MSEILNKLEKKLSRSQNGEIISNITLGIWVIVGCVCFLTDVIKIHAVMIVFAITVFIIIAVDGYFLFASFYYRRKIKRQKQKEGFVGADERT